MVWDLSVVAVALAVWVVVDRAAIGAAVRWIARVGGHAVVEAASSGGLLIARAVGVMTLVVALSWGVRIADHGPAETAGRFLGDPTDEAVADCLRQQRALHRWLRSDATASTSPGVRGGRVESHGAYCDGRSYRLDFDGRLYCRAHGSNADLPPVGR